MSAEKAISSRSYLLEGCAVDPFLKDPAFFDLVSHLRNSGRIEVLITDLTRDDINKISNETRRGKLLDVLSRLKPTTTHYPASLVSPHEKRSRPTLPGNVTTCSEETVALLQRLGGGGRADARQAAAAHIAGATLVTDDRKLVARALREGIPAFTTDQWRDELVSLAGCNEAGST